MPTLRLPVICCGPLTGDVISPGDADELARRQRGKWAYYRIVDDALASLAAAIRPVAA